MIALCVLGAVSLVLWLSVPGANAPSYEQVQTATRTICGQVDSKAMPGNLLVVTNSGTVEIVALAEVTSWVEVANCPQPP